ncbi:tRNA lysidine(34) synthetase TilS [Thioalkalivibrio sp. ALJ16]|uniref:tRNA lysidine(34) synthetase TilS n=1 Tax=Thioalkalivibrio sp. ALJ16 TaxID=1158762 RepID=UPI0004754F17|nr:tRNA lysidine(34) synthetase TilS [Thioalkalivibrio sp. ALJ16]
MPSRKPPPDPRAAADDPVVAALRDFLKPASGPRRVRVAFSGGLDSSVLLHAATRLGVAGLEAMHVDHRLRPDAPLQAEHCAAMAGALGCLFQLRVLAPLDRTDGGLEAAARKARYARLREGLGADDLILTAQHADDQAETFLLAALRGSGPDGLQGMRPRRREGATWLGRPFLNLPRAALIEYAQRAHLDWYDDPSNRDLRFDRNFLRHSVMPRLRERFGGSAGLARAAAWQQEAVARLRARDAARLPAPDDMARPWLELDRLRPLQASEQRGLLRQWLRQQGLRPPGHERLQEFLRQVLAASPDASPCVAWDDGWMRRYQGRVYAGPGPATAADAEPPPDHLWPVEQREFVLPDGRCLNRDMLPALGVERDAALTVSYRRGGEQVLTAGGRRSLKKLLQARGIPPWERQRIPLLRRSDGELVAVVWPEMANARS